MKLSNIVDNINKKHEEAKAKIKEVYKSDDRPWIIGYSGGKDSTAVVHVVFEALLEMDKKDLTKHVYVISSDTLVETPLIISQIDESLKNMQVKAKEMNIPLTTHKVRPLYSNSFWANIIGRGYPSPNQTFRWCTDRMKIDPANRFIRDVVDEYGEAVMLLGIRKGESASRDRVIDTHTVKNKDLMRHSTLTNAFVFAPIVNYDINDVWDTLLNSPSPWGANNQELYKLYSDSNSNECPLVIDTQIKESAGSCGNSRFGCWTCTVVAEDKALSGFIKNGISWLEPLLDFRNWLTDIRDERSLRMKKRTSGQIYFSSIIYKNNQFIIPKKAKRDKLIIDEQKMLDGNGEKWNLFASKKDAIKFIKENEIDLASDRDPRIIIKMKDGYGQLGLGPFTFETRKEILKRLLLVQKKLSDEYNKAVDLIKKEELIEISKIWIEHGYWDNDVNKIYKDVFRRDLKLISDDINIFSAEELETLKKLCRKHNLDFDLIKKLLYMEKNSFGLTRRDSIQKEIARLLKQDYLHM